MIGAWVGGWVNGWMDGRTGWVDREIDGWIPEIVAQACSIFTEPLGMIWHLPTSVTKSCFSVVWGLCLIMITLFLQREVNEILILVIIYKLTNCPSLSLTWIFL